MSKTRNLGELGINLQKIVTRLMANQELLKLLYYTDKDPLNNENLTSKIISEDIYENLIKVVPKLHPQESAKSKISLRVVGGNRSRENIQFTNIAIQVEVFVPLTQWMIKDTNLRPFAIMGEIEKSLDGKVISGIGRMKCESFQLNFITEKMSCYKMDFGIVQYE